MVLRQRLNCCFLILQVSITSIVFAEQSEEQVNIVSEPEIALKLKIKNRSGYETDSIGMGGRSSVTKQLYLDDIFLPDHLRFPEFDKSLQPYYEWKRGIRQKRNLQLGTDYTSLFQRASDSLTTHQSAAGGVYRL